MRDNLNFLPEVDYNNLKRKKILVDKLQECFKIY